MARPRELSVQRWSRQRSGTSGSDSATVSFSAEWSGVQGVRGQGEREGEGLMVRRRCCPPNNEGDWVRLGTKKR